MRIREFTLKDIPDMRRIHAESGLPQNCLPDFESPLFVVKKVAENGSGPAIGGFLKLNGEIFLLLDHSKGTPESRWEALEELTGEGLHEAYKVGLDHVTAWLPPEVEKQFGKRLESLGFQRSPWNSYTAILR